MTPSGLRSRALPQGIARGLGHMACLLGFLKMAESLEPSKLTAYVREKYSDLELDALHLAGQGASDSSLAHTTPTGSSLGTNGRLNSRSGVVSHLAAATVVLKPLALSLIVLSTLQITVFLLSGLISHDEPSHPSRDAVERRDAPGSGRRYRPLSR